MSEKASSATTSPREEESEARPNQEKKGKSPGEKRDSAPASAAVTWTEERLNAPSRQTVGMLTVLATATLIFWAAGRAACNYHEPGESLSPKEVSLEARTRTEKDTAFELQQRWVSADFETAAKLVAGALSQTLEQERKACQGAACEARRAAHENIFSVAEVLQRNSTSAFVRVRTVGAPGGEVTHVYELARVDSAPWKATRRLAANEPVPQLADVSSKEATHTEETGSAPPAP